MNNLTSSLIQKINLAGLRGQVVVAVIFPTSASQNPEPLIATTPYVQASASERDIRW
jgi:hypothetical protein